MQVYDSTVYDPNIPQPPNSLYNVDLRLGRPLMDDVMRTVSPLFVPETSPIALYTNGLLAMYQYETDLDPTAYVDIEQIGARVQRILMWSSVFVTRRIKDGQRFIDEDILRIPNDDGDFEEFRVGDDMPLTMFILTANTGAISPADYMVLLRFFVERKVIIFMPELMVIINKVIVDQTAMRDILLNEQLEDVLTKLPNRRVTLSFGDTVSKA